jgi:hypothetical protein
MSPALFVLPPLPAPPAPAARGPEQLRLPPAAAFLALAFVPPARARQLCRRLPPARAPLVLPPAAPPAPARSRPSRPAPKKRAAPAKVRQPGRGLSRSLGTGPLTKEELAEARRIRRERLPVLPTTRAACAAVPRPCPFVSCRHHLYLDVTHGGAVKLLFPDREPGDMPAAWSCSLDVAERLEHRGASLPQIGRAINTSMARAGQIQDEALAKLREHPEGPALLEAMASAIAARAETES